MNRVPVSAVVDLFPLPCKLVRAYLFPSPDAGVPFARLSLVPSPISHYGVDRQCRSSHERDGDRIHRERTLSVPFLQKLTPK